MLNTNIKILIVNPGKGLLKSIALTEVDKKFDNVKETPQKDSLQILIKEFVENKINKIGENKDSTKEGKKNINIKFDDDEIDAKMEMLMDSLNVYLKDNIVDDTDLQKVIELLKENSNEGSKKNRN